MEKQDIYAVRRKLNMIVQKQNEIKLLVDEIHNEIGKNEMEQEYNPKIPLIDTPYNTETDIAEYNKMPLKRNTSIGSMSYGNEYDLDSDYDDFSEIDDMPSGEIYMSPNLANIVNNDINNNFIVGSPIKTEWKPPLKPGLDN